VRTLDQWGEGACSKGFVVALEKLKTTKVARVYTSESDSMEFPRDLV
jgi:hypothetical protein